MHRFQTRKSNRKIKQNVKRDHVKMKILRCCTHRWEFSLPFLAMRLKPGVRVSSELALHGSFGDVSWKEMRPSVWYRIQDDQVMIFKKINEQGNHLVPCAMRMIMNEFSGVVGSQRHYDNLFYRLLQNDAAGAGGVDANCQFIAFKGRQTTSHS